MNVSTLSRRPQPAPSKQRLVVPAYLLLAAVIFGPPAGYLFWRSLFDWWIDVGMPEPLAAYIAVMGALVTSIFGIFGAAFSAIEMKVWRPGVMAWRPYFEPTEDAR